MTEPSPGLTLDPTIIAELAQLDSLRPGTLATIADRFIEQGLGLIQTLTTADDGDHESIRHAAHHLKGSSATIGARDLASLCGDIEARARADQSTHALRVQLPRVFSSIRPAIERLGS